jgi:hypothetical protein
MDKYVLVPIDAAQRLPENKRKYYPVKLKSNNSITELMFEGDNWYDNEWDRTYELGQITNWYEEKPIEEVIKERMPSEEEMKQGAIEFAENMSYTNDIINNQAHLEGSTWLRDKLLKQD